MIYTKPEYLDLHIKEINPSYAKSMRGNYRYCTLSHRGGDFYINLRLPEDIKSKIVRAYQQGKEVRIFS